MLGRPAVTVQFYSCALSDSKLGIIEYLSRFPTFEAPKSCKIDEQYSLNCSKKKLTRAISWTIGLKFQRLAIIYPLTYQFIHPSQELFLVLAISRSILPTFAT